MYRVAPNSEQQNRHVNMMSEVSPYDYDKFCIVQIEQECVLHDHNKSSIQYFVELPKSVNINLQFKKNVHGIKPSYFSCKLDQLMSVECLEENINQLSTKLHELETRLSTNIDKELLKFA
jgi:hypothetical protein